MCSKSTALEPPARRDSDTLLHLAILGVELARNYREHARGRTGRACWSLGLSIRGNRLRVHVDGIVEVHGNTQFVARATIGDEARKHPIS